MNSTLLNFKLNGEYKFCVYENNDVVHETEWSSNTILSGGLIDLYTYDIPSLLKYLDFGKSNFRPGIQGYPLSGVDAVADTSSLRDILASTEEVLTENQSTRIYYRAYTTLPATSETTIREFAIKRAPGSNAFARNTFDPTNIKKGQYVIFQYRLRADWSSQSKYNLRVQTASNNTYTIPVTGTPYQIPYDRTYYNNNQLVILQSSEPIPSFGATYPTNILYGVQNRPNSLFKPTELGYSINHVTRTVSVSTCYNNVSAGPIGIHSNINCLLLSKDGSTLQQDNFFVTNLKFPIVLYNLEPDTAVTTSLTFSALDMTTPIGPYASPVEPVGRRTNLFTFNVVYTWREGTL